MSHASQKTYRSLIWSFPQNLTRPTFLAQCVLGPGRMLPICSWSEGIRVVMFFSKRSGLGGVCPSMVEETEGLLARVSVTKSYVFQDFSILKSLNNTWLATKSKPNHQFEVLNLQTVGFFCEFLYNFSLAQGSQVDGAIYVVFQGSVGFYRAAPGLMWREDEGRLSKWWLYDPQRATKLCETVGSWITWDAIEWYLAEIFG